MENKSKLKVVCPKCKKEFLYYESKFRPFCSKRCKMVDLGAWLSDSYAVPGSEPLKDEVEDENERTDENEEE